MLRDQFAVVAHAAEMVAAPQRDDALPALLGARDRVFDHDLAHVLAEAVVPVVADQRAVVDDAFRPAVERDVTFGQHAPVVRQDRHAVARVADAIGFDQMLGDVVRDVGRHRQLHEGARRETASVVDGDFHCSSLCLSMRQVQIHPSQRHHVALNSINSR